MDIDASSQQLEVASPTILVGWRDPSVDQNCLHKLPCRPLCPPAA
jgi:hypothetical protein